jgi:hypothetical protein
VNSGLNSAPSGGPPEPARAQHSVVEKAIDAISDHIILAIIIAVLGALGLSRIVDAEETFEKAISKTVPLTVAVLIVVRAVRTRAIDSYTQFWVCLTLALAGAGFFTRVFCHECAPLEMQNHIFQMKGFNWFSIPLGLLSAYYDIYRGAFWISVGSGVLVGWASHKPEHG